MILPPRFDTSQYGGLTPEMHTIFKRHNLLVLDHFFTQDLCDEIKKISEENTVFAHETSIKYMNETDDLPIFANTLHESDCVGVSVGASGSISGSISGTINSTQIDRLYAHGHSAAHHDIFSPFLNDAILQTLIGLGYKSPALAVAQYDLFRPNNRAQTKSSQDGSLLWTETKPSLSIWVALDDIVMQEGCMWALPGRYMDQKPRKRLICGPNAAAWEVMDNMLFMEKNRFPLEMKKGGIIVHSGLLPYLFGSNRSKNHIHSMKFQFIDHADTYSAQNWLQPSAEKPFPSLHSILSKEL